MFKQILAQFFTKHCTKTKVYAQILYEILVDIQRVVYPPIVGTTVYIYISAILPIDLKLWREIPICVDAPAEFPIVDGR